VHLFIYEYKYKIEQSGSSDKLDKVTTNTAGSTSISSHIDTEDNGTES